MKQLITQKTKHSEKKGYRNSAPGVVWLQIAHFLHSQYWYFI